MVQPYLNFGKIYNLISCLLALAMIQQFLPSVQMNFGPLFQILESWKVSSVRQMTSSNKTLKAGGKQIFWWEKSRLCVVALCLLPAPLSYRCSRKDEGRTAPWNIHISGCVRMPAFGIWCAEGASQIALPSPTPKPSISCCEFRAQSQWIPKETQQKKSTCF